MSGLRVERDGVFARVVLETASVLVDAIALYRAHGFTRVERAHLGGGEDGQHGVSGPAGGGSDTGLERTRQTVARKPRRRNFGAAIGPGGVGPWSHWRDGGHASLLAGVADTPRSPTTRVEEEPGPCARR